MSGRTGLDKGSNIRLIMERNNIQSAVYIGDTVSGGTLWEAVTADCFRQFPLPDRAV